jgi:hypothetical protein
MSILNFFTNKHKNHIKKTPIIITPTKIIMMNLPIHAPKFVFLFLGTTLLRSHTKNQLVLFT